MRPPILCVYWVSFYPHDKEDAMPYEVVDPADRDERGAVHSTLTAAMLNASPTLEVWELGGSTGYDRTVRCWPDEEFTPTVDLNVERTKRFVKDSIGRAEREATAILAEHEHVSQQQVHALLSLAWGRGFIAGAQFGSETYASVLSRLADEVGS